VGASSQALPVQHRTPYDFYSEAGSARVASLAWVSRAVTRNIVARMPPLGSILHLGAFSTDPALTPCVTLRAVWAASAFFPIRLPIRSPPARWWTACFGVKELLENALDAGATRIRVEVEAGGRKLIRITDDATEMNRDDALLAFERHATSKLRTADDLLSIATLDSGAQALPSIASVARVTLETCAESSTDGERAGTRLEIAGGKILHVDDAALPRGTTLAVADLFFTLPLAVSFSAPNPLSWLT